MESSQADMWQPVLTYRFSTQEHILCQWPCSCCWLQHIKRLHRLWGFSWILLSLPYRRSILELFTEMYLLSVSLGAINLFPVVGTEENMAVVFDMVCWHTLEWAQPYELSWQNGSSVRWVDNDVLIRKDKQQSVKSYNIPRSLAPSANREFDFISHCKVFGFASVCTIWTHTHLSPSLENSNSALVLVAFSFCVAAVLYFVFWPGSQRPRHKQADLDLK